MARVDVPRLGVVVLDCPDPRALAAFYARLLNWPQAEETPENTWVELHGEDGAGIAFQRSPEYQPSTWPDPSRPQMVHLDFTVGDLAAAHERAVGLGARVLDDSHETFIVYADPDGHPFCLCACNN